jgi:hypothetical protein
MSAYDYSQLYNAQYYQAMAAAAATNSWPQAATAYASNWKAPSA